MPKCVVLGVTGSIAAYKAVELVSRLVKRGVDVWVIMTRNAAEFVTPLTFETLSSHPVVVDMFDRIISWDVEHIALAKRADVFCVAPATANFLGKVANGIADDMLTTTIMATRAPVLVAPAMNTRMYDHPITQRNIETLKALGWHMMEPAEGRLACGDVGRGKLADVTQIEDKILELLSPRMDMEGLSLLVTAGPTREIIDPVRYMTNRSSGKMGYALAEAAAARGAKVHLVSGPVSLPCPEGVERVLVESTQQMLQACLAAFPGVDIAIMAAAPADFRPLAVSDQKIKKQGNGLELKLVENEDIAALLGAMKTLGQTLAVFAAETEALLQYARQKMERKNADMVVANDVNGEGAGFEVETNVATLLFRDGRQLDCPMMDKRELAHRILDEVLQLRGGEV